MGKYDTFIYDTGIVYDAPDPIPTPTPAPQPSRPAVRTYRVGDLLILNTRPAGWTRGDWMVVNVAGPEKYGGPIYTLRNSANNTETTSASRRDLDLHYHFKNPRRNR